MFPVDSYCAPVGLPISPGRSRKVGYSSLPLKSWCHRNTSNYKCENSLFGPIFLSDPRAWTTANLGEILSVECCLPGSTTKRRQQSEESRSPSLEKSCVDVWREERKLEEGVDWKVWKRSASRRRRRRKKGSLDDTQPRINSFTSLCTLWNKDSCLYIYLV